MAAAKAGIQRRTLNPTTNDTECLRPRERPIYAAGTMEAQAGAPYHLDMSKLLRGLAAGYGAKKLGGGCFSTILIFLILWWLLGNFDIFR